MTHAYALGGFWQPLESGWLPSVSLGWGINQSDTQREGQVSTSQSWTVGLEWNDVFMEGNNAWHGGGSTRLRDRSAWW